MENPEGKCHFEVAYKIEGVGAYWSVRVLDEKKVIASFGVPGMPPEQMQEFLLKCYELIGGSFPQARRDAQEMKALASAIQQQLDGVWDQAYEQFSRSCLTPLSATASAPS